MLIIIEAPMVTTNSVLLMCLIIMALTPTMNALLIVPSSVAALLITPHDYDELRCACAAEHCGRGDYDECPSADLSIVVVAITMNALLLI